MQFWGVVQPRVIVQFRFFGRPEGGLISDLAGSVDWIRLGDNFCVVLGYSRLAHV